MKVDTSEPAFLLGSNDPQLLSYDTDSGKVASPGMKALPLSNGVYKWFRFWRYTGVGMVFRNVEKQSRRVTAPAQTFIPPKPQLTNSEAPSLLCYPPRGRCCGWL